MEQYNSVKGIADLISLRLGLEDNHAVRESLKFTFLYYRAEHIRQDIARNGVNALYLQDYIDDLVEVDSAISCKVSTGCTILRTKRTIPQVIRQKSNSLFPFIGSVDRSKVFIRTRLEDADQLVDYKYAGSPIGWDLIDNYVYILGAKRVKYVRISAPWFDPTKVNNGCEMSSCFTEEDILPMPADMISRIVNGIISGEFKILNQDKTEVEVDGNNSNNN